VECLTPRTRITVHYTHTKRKTGTINIGRKVDWKATQLHIWWLDGYCRWLCGMRATWHTFTNCLSPLKKKKRKLWNVFAFRVLHILPWVGLNKCLKNASAENWSNIPDVFCFLKKKYICYVYSHVCYFKHFYFSFV